MNKTVTVIALSLGVTFVMFSIITLRVDVSFIDGSPLSFYGFPFSYIQFSQVSSLSYIVSYQYLLIDFVVYYFFVFCFVSINKAYLFLTKKLWLTVATLMVMALVPITTILVSTYWAGDLAMGEGEITNYSVHFGYGRPYYHR